MRNIKTERRKTRKYEKSILKQNTRKTNVEGTKKKLTIKKKRKTKHRKTNCQTEHRAMHNKCTRTHAHTPYMIERAVHQQRLQRVQRVRDLQHDLIARPGGQVALQSRQRLGLAPLRLAVALRAIGRRLLRVR